ncbi:hypothetical protein BDW74DRAFT_157506 [Aspergillus multicolor]|uniref:uncharacterized protein n=1 Tax=Aspergillus multicolor TaxID=41759 RepID=UPI003CCCE72A
MRHLQGPQEALRQGPAALSLLHRPWSSLSIPDLQSHSTAPTSTNSSFRDCSPHRFSQDGLQKR